MQITTKEAASMIRNSGGKLFSVTFEKRNKPGVIRRLTGRVGVRKDVKGVGQKFNPADHNLLTVYEFVTDPERDERGRVRCMATQWRSVGIERIRSLKIKGFTFDVV